MRFLSKHTESSSDAAGCGDKRPAAPLAPPAAKRTADGSSPPPALRIATLNVRGMGTFSPHVAALMAEYKADVYILTETKSTVKRCNPIHGAAVRDFCIFNTAAPGRAHAGVTMLVKKDVFPSHSLINTSSGVAPALAGHYLRLTARTVLDQELQLQRGHVS